MIGARSRPAICRLIVAACLALAMIEAASLTAFGQVELSQASLDDLIGPYLSPVDAPNARQIERGMVELARQNRLSASALAETSLILEGSESAEWIPVLRKRAEEWNADLAKELTGLDSRASGERILAYLHRRVLTGGYEANTSSLVATLKEGRYNCVSASLLFLALAEKQGLTAAGVQRPGHVFCRVCAASITGKGGEWLDVETTCAKCGVPAHRGEVAGARQVTPAEFLAKCYYNLGVAHLQAHRFADAVACCALAWQLDPRDERARDNLLASLNNGALQRCEMGDFRGAESLLSRAARISPEYPPLVANEAYLARLRVSRLCGDDRFAEAMGVVSELRSKRPNSGVAAALEAQIRRQFAGREIPLPSVDSSPAVQTTDSSRGDLTTPGF